LREEINHICAIIAKHNVQKYIRLRHLHRHFRIPEGHILLGTSIKEPPGYWTRPVPVLDINRNRIGPYILSVDKNTGERRENKDTLSPSEFREGAPAIHVDSEFVSEVTAYIQTKGLENTLGLEIIDGGPRRKMIEFSFRIGSILLQEQEVKPEIREERGGDFKLRETAWSISVEDGVVDKTGEERCVTFATVGHILVVDEPKGLWDVVNILQDKGFISRQ
jgi:hypothetical protein